MLLCSVSFLGVQVASTPLGSRATSRLDTTACRALLVEREPAADAFGARLLGGLVVRPALHLL